MFTASPRQVTNSLIEVLVNGNAATGPHPGGYPNTLTNHHAPPRLPARTAPAPRVQPWLA